ncbi:MAG TPA: response regulator [Burkholderiales bacterium]|nr:response regulator [Burkholderiales bacterium]
MPDQPGRIVVVDDDHVMRTLLDMHLRNAGYEVFMAEDAVEGGHLIMKILPDLIICDVDMPYLNGYEFVAALKTHDTTRAIPVVFLTSNEDLDGATSRLGAAAHLTKPVRADRLLEVVERFAGKP